MNFIPPLKNKDPGQKKKFKNLVTCSLKKAHLNRYDGKTLKIKGLGKKTMKILAKESRYQKKFFLLKTKLIGTRRIFKLIKVKFQ